MLWLNLPVLWSYLTMTRNAIVKSAMHFWHEVAWHYFRQEWRTCNLKFCPEYPVTNYTQVRISKMVHIKLNVMCRNMVLMSRQHWTREPFTVYKRKERVEFNAPSSNCTNLICLCKSFFWPKAVYLPAPTDLCRTCVGLTTIKCNITQNRKQNSYFVLRIIIIIINSFYRAQITFNLHVLEHTKTGRGKIYIKLKSTSLKGKSGADLT